MSSFKLSSPSELIDSRFDSDFVREQSVMPIGLSVFSGESSPKAEYRWLASISALLC